VSLSSIVLVKRVFNVLISCGDVGKLTRVAATVSDPMFSSLYPRANKNAPFLVLGGFSDFLLPSAYSNGHGAITGLANVAPVRVQFWIEPRFPDLRLFLSMLL
jgi:4-hydroxy-2-oxoglutarate aldolase